MLAGMNASDYVIIEVKCKPLGGKSYAIGKQNKRYTPTQLALSAQQVSSRVQDPLKLLRSEGRGSSLHLLRMNLELIYFKCDRYTG